MQPPILLDFPDHFETERLLIRAPRAGDGAAMHEAATESAAELRRFMDWAIAPSTVADKESFVRQASAWFLERKSLPMLIFERETGVYLGSTGLHDIHWGVRAFEIGYWLRTSATNKGYMTEAVKGLTRFTFEELNANRVEIRCDSDNVRSASVARRAGFTQEGHLRKNRLNTSGEITDTLIFGMLREEYAQLYS